MFLERAAGIEPASLAWKAKVLPLHNARLQVAITIGCNDFGQARIHNRTAYHFEVGFILCNESTTVRIEHAAESVSTPEMLDV